MANSSTLYTTMAFKEIQNLSSFTFLGSINVPGLHEFPVIILNYLYGVTVYGMLYIFKLTEPKSYSHHYPSTFFKK